jgi:hypothetical protein
MSTALTSVYPEHEWLIWKFVHIPKGFFQKQENCKKFFEWLGKKLGVKNFEDWYNISLQDVVKYGGKNLLLFHGGSLRASLAFTYPDYDWQNWRFPRVSRGYWDNIQNVKISLEWIGQQLKVSNLEDWYRVSVQEINQLGGSTPLMKYGGKAQLLKAVYPNYSWNLTKFAEENAHKAQKYLEASLKQLFPSEDIFMNFKLTHGQEDMVFFNFIFIHLIII